MVKDDSYQKQTLYGHSLPETQQMMIVENHDAVKEATGATIFEWWQLIFLPIILAMIGLVTVWLKVRERNKARNASPDPEEVGEETIMQFLKSEITRRKDDGGK